MKESTGSVTIEVHVHCPYCDEFINLMDERESTVNHDNGLTYAVFDTETPWSEYEEETNCPNCKKDFKISGIHY